MNEIEKFPLTSMNIKEEQIAKLKELFPEVFTEGSKIDWDKLRLTLGEQVDVGKERYGMNWPGKADCFKTIQQPSVATLVPAREESVNFDTTENLFIEGDNLEVLKLLQKSYIGKIKMIYIDPPYNTGNEFIYPDNYAESLDTYLEYTAQKDSEGRKFSTNVETDGRFHSKWMNMMYPRLFLAKNLLSADGVIFVSIDDNEYINLKILCNDIYGEENFLCTFVWKRRASSALTDKNISTDHEYVLVYNRGDLSSFNGIKKDFIAYKNPDDDPRGEWTLGDLTVGMTKDQRPNQFYDLTDPKTGKLYKANPDRVWAFIPESMNELIKEGRVFFPVDESKRPMLKRFKSNLKSQFNPISSILEVGMNAEGTKIIRETFGATVFNYSKPITLIKELLRQSTQNSDIVLDFFAGSASTAHAVLEVNAEEGTNRKFICVQLPETISENSDAFNAGFTTIADIGKERIRRVIGKILDDEERKKINRNSTTGIFDENETEQPSTDLGFKVFKLSPSNFETWNADVEKQPEAIQEQLFHHIDHISDSAGQEAILYELLLKSGFQLTTKIERMEIEGMKVFSIQDGAMLICLEKELTNELMKAMAALKPARVICLDEGFRNNDQLKANAVLIMKSNNVIKFQTI